MQLQHSPGGGRNKACIILCCTENQQVPDHDRWITKLEYNICIVDLKSDIVSLVDDGDGFPLVSPTFQIDCGVTDRHRPITDAFCVLGQTLYMFEGSSYAEPYASRKSVFAVDLTQTQTLTQRTTKLTKDGPLLKKIGDMTVPKPGPVAFPTPEGEKIVVLSRYDSTLELFEPVSRSWEQLPTITEARWGVSDGLYGFIDSSYKLLVQANYTRRTGRFYLLDLASSANDRRWVKLGTIYSGVDHIPCDSSFFETVEKGRFCFVNSWGFYDLEGYDRGEVHLYGFPCPQQDFSSGTDYCVALLNYGGKGECDLCHMVMDRKSGGTHSCRASVDVCRVDLKSYKEAADRLSMSDLRWNDELRLSKTMIVKTLRFSLGFEGVRKVYEPHLFFTF